MSYGICLSCKPHISTPSPCPPTVSKSECLELCTYRYHCGDGPKPGDTIVVDLTTRNNVEACGDGGGTYSIREYDTEFYSNVSITPQGMLTFTTSLSFKKDQEACITYHYCCNDSVLSADGYVWACKKDECSGKDAPCNQQSGDTLVTTGGVFGTHPDFETTDDNEIPDHITITTVVPAPNDPDSGDPVTLCTGVVTYEIVDYSPKELTNVAIDSTGKVTYDADCKCLNFPADILINYSATDCGITVYGEVRRYLDPCKGNPKCDPCDGVVVKAEEGKLETTCGSSVSFQTVTSGGEDFYILDGGVLENVTISSTGVISFTVPTDGLDFKNSYIITYRVKRGKITCDSKLVVTLCDLCIGIPLKEGEKCDSCSGTVYTVEDKEFEAVCDLTQTFDISQTGFTEYNVLGDGGLTLDNLSSTGALTIITDDQSAGKTFIVLIEGKVGTIVCKYNVTITIPDLSIGLDCPKDCIANPCTGNCDPIPPTLLVEEQLIEEDFC